MASRQKGKMRAAGKAITRSISESTAKSLQTHRGVAGSAEFRGDFLLNFSALPLRPLRLRGEIDLFAVDSRIALDFIRVPFHPCIQRGKEADSYPRQMGFVQARLPWASRTVTRR